MDNVLEKLLPKAPSSKELFESVLEKFPPEKELQELAEKDPIKDFCI